MREAMRLSRARCSRLRCPFPTGLLGFRQTVNYHHALRALNRCAVSSQVRVTHSGAIAQLEERLLCKHSLVSAVRSSLFPGGCLPLCEESNGYLKVQVRALHV